MMFYSGGLDKRRAPRRAITIPADLRLVAGSKFAIVVDDISASGFRCDCLARFVEGQRVLLHIASFSPFPASVTWQAGDSYGFRFAAPLHMGVFDTLVKRYAAF